MVALWDTDADGFNAEMKSAGAPKCTEADSLLAGTIDKGANLRRLSYYILYNFASLELLLKYDNKRRVLKFVVVRNRLNANSSGFQRLGNCHAHHNSVAL